MTMLNRYVLIVRIAGWLCVFLVATFLVGWALPVLVDRQSEYECQRLLRQSQEFPLFWLTPSEKEMCDQIGVQIDARVKLSDEL